MGRCIDKPIAGHDAVDAAAARVVIDVPVILVLVQIHELDAGTGWHNIVFCCLAGIASLMEPVDIVLACDFRYDLTGMEIPAGIVPTVLDIRGSSGPDQSVNYKDILRRIMSGAGLRSIPQLCAVRGRQCCYASRLLETSRSFREEQNVVVNHYPGCIGRVDLLAGNSLGFPVFLAIGPIDANNLCPVIKVYGFRIG